MIQSSGQLSLPMEPDYFREPDRNFELGGRSFYFFDFDDNVVHLPTKISLFHKKTGEQKELSTIEFAKVEQKLGQKGSEWEFFEMRFSEQDGGSFRAFREFNAPCGTPYLIKDLEQALKNPFLEWRGPSWSFFTYAVKNNRPISIITARGHKPNSIKRAINMLVQSRDLDAHPNYLSVYPVSHKETVRSLVGKDSNSLSVPELKKRAIRAAVQDAFECYGQSPYHRFGMSDDDPKNVKLILEAMHELKAEYPENAFFVINTHGRALVKEEVLLKGKTEETDLGKSLQNQERLELS